MRAAASQRTLHFKMPSSPLRFEALLLDDGSLQSDLWGINLYPAEPGDGFIEFDAMINVRPSQGNPSRDVLDDGTRSRIRAVVSRLAPE